MADFIFRISPNIILGSYSLSRLGQFAADYGSKYMVVLDPMLKELGVAEKVTQSLSSHQIDFFIFDDISSGATTKSIEQALKLAREAHIHGVISVGGSKSTDVAKTISAIFNETHDLYDFVEGASPTTEPLPLICVPTTIRDSFVFTPYTPVIDSRANKTTIIKHQNALCKLVVFDPNLCVTLTENQTATMALETLCIATEAYVSPKASFFSDMLVEKSVELIGYARDSAPSLTITTPSEVLLTQGGCMASLASSMSSVGTATLIAISINAKYNISRSLVTSVLFPTLIEDYAKFKGERIAKLSKCFRTTTEDVSEEEAVTAFAENIRQRIAKANLPARLKDLGLTMENLALVAEDAGALELTNYLPRSMTSDDLFDLMKLAF